MKKWLKERQQQQELDAALGIHPSAAAAAAASSSTSSSSRAASKAITASAAGADGSGDNEISRNGWRRKKTAYQYGISVQKEREQMLQAMEGFRNSIAAAGVCLDPEASAALEGIMTGELLEAAGIAPPPFGASVNSRAAGGIYQSIAAGGSASNSFASSAAISHDECAHQLVEMLHLLKKAPPPGGAISSEYSQGFSSSSSSSRSSSDGDNDEEGSGDHDDRDHSEAETGRRSTRSSKNRGTGAVVGKRGRTGGGYEEAPRSSSPTSSAVASANLLSSHLERVDQLRKRKRGTSNNGKDTDLQMIH